MDATSNIPGMFGADENDTFYRNVVTMEVHLELGYHVFLEREWFQIGLIRLDDLSGEEGSLGMRMIIGEHQDEGFSLAFDQAFPRDSFVLEEHVDVLDQIIVMSLAGDVDVIVVGVLQAQANGIVKYLTENGYAGSLLFNTTSTTTDIFDIVTGLPGWLAEGNEILGIQPDNYQGKNSQAFTDAFRERYGQEPSPYGSTAYDCTFALALALLYSAADDLSPAGVWEHMPRFKEPNRTPDEVEIGIGAEQFARAAEVISGGGRVALEGASGPLLFDGNGDRPRQGMCTFGPNQAVDGWEIKERYDSELHKL
jgi:hypothetical protein